MLDAETGSFRSLLPAWLHVRTELGHPFIGTGMLRSQLNQAGPCCRPLITKASWFHVRSPWSPAPSIRLLFISLQLRFMLPTHAQSPSRSDTILRLLWINLLWNFHPQECAMLGAHKKSPAIAGLW